MSKEKIENLIYSLENEKDSWHPSSDSKKKAMLDKLKKDLSKFESVVNEEATCCGKCGRVHIKGNCKRPFLKGKSHCRTK